MSAPARRKPVASLKALAIGYLSRREYSRQELRRRLLDAAVRARVPAPDAAIPADPVHPLDSPDRPDPLAEVEAVLDWMQAHGYLSDVRFVESRVQARAARHGTQRIRQELAHHGLALNAVQAAALQESEHARAHAVWARKFGHLPADLRERAAQYRFMTGRGFSAEVVRRIVGGDDDA